MNWRTVKFWDNVRNSLGMFGLGSNGVNGVLESQGITHMPDVWMTGLSVFCLLGFIFTFQSKIWFVDDNKDGIVDILEDKE